MKNKKRSLSTEEVEANIGGLVLRRAHFRGENQSFSSKIIKAMFHLTSVRKGTEKKESATYPISQHTCNDVGP